MNQNPRERLCLGICEFYNPTLHGECDDARMSDYFFYTCQVELAEFYDGSIFEYLSEYPGTLKYTGVVRSYWSIVSECVSHVGDCAAGYVGTRRGMRGGHQDVLASHHSAQMEAHLCRTAPAIIPTSCTVWVNAERNWRFKSSHEIFQVLRISRGRRRRRG